MTETIFNQSFFAKHFDKFEHIFNRDDAHPENFYLYFYDEFIYGTDYLTDEMKAEWMKEFAENWDDPAEFESLACPFDEFIEQEEYFKEDIACSMISDEFPELKAKAIPELFMHISEMWSEEGIQSAIDEINSGRIKSYLGGGGK